MASRPSAIVHGRRLQGELKVISASLEQTVIERILKHAGLEPPPKALAREAVPHHAC